MLKRICKRWYEELRRDRRLMSEKCYCEKKIYCADFKELRNGDKKRE